ncbi:hypothetical protein B0H17DRAFT_1139464 [Mycena rosella]|uniref:C2H2-type domain-containing protein n=1 Tax=Mycena rosella TaxID=1033263 RepID=A0AAD7D7V9_MYCRO|nr:hypothetical protein B0H17DRAFT_1139464 [Mycena rosella]
MNKSTGPNRLFVLTPMPHGSSFTCTVCLKTCKSRPGLTQHHHAKHREFTPASEDEDDNTFGSQYHPLLNALPCDAHGVFLPPYIGPPPPPAAPVDGQDPAAWEPFGERADFDFAHFHFVEAQSSEKRINTALDIWAASVHKYGGKAPWKNAQELYAAIDSIQDGQAPWKTYKLRYSGPLPPGRPPKWMTQTYDLCTRDTRQLLRNQLGTTAFKGHINMVPYRQFNHGGKRVWSNLMSGDWAWKQADAIAKDVRTHGAMLVPGVGGSDKTTVSYATGHQEFHPSYLSPGVLTGTARRGHGNAVLPSSFLPIPKSEFCSVFQPLKAAMTTPEVVKCPDGHFRRVIYSLRPYIADYPEQVWLTAIVQNWCPKCDAHPDALDEEGARLRSQTKTEFLITQFDPGILWDDFGIRSDVVPFTSDFPRADIYELISCVVMPVAWLGLKARALAWLERAWAWNSSGQSPSPPPGLGLVWLWPEPGLEDFGGLNPVYLFKMSVG